VNGPWKAAHALLIITAVTVLAIPACSTAKPSGNTHTSAAQVVSAPPKGQLDRPGVLSICTETGTPPAAFYDDKGTLSGYLPDLGNAIAARMGLPANWVDSVFDTIIIAANTGKCDIVIADQFITAARQKQIDMIPYGQLGEQFMSTAPNKQKFGDPSKDEDALCGLKIGTLLGGAEYNYLKQQTTACVAAGRAAINISTTTGSPAGLQALQSGLTQLFFTDSPISGYYAQQHPEQFATVGAPINPVQAGISVPKAKTGLQASVRAVLRAMKADGSYQKIFAKWGQQSMPLPNPGVA
jgi:polar amino acid transport system substrate-binding protein